MWFDSSSGLAAIVSDDNRPSLRTIRASKPGVARPTGNIDWPKATKSVAHAEDDG